MLPLPVAEGYDYLSPAPPPCVGSFVEVPLGKRQALGVVWGPGSGAVDTKKLKAIERVLDLPPLPEALRRFVDWVAHYTVTPPGTILKMALGGKFRALKDKDKEAPPSQKEGVTQEPDSTLISCVMPPHPSPPRKGEGFQQPSLSPEQRDAANQLIAQVDAERFSATLLDGVTGSGKTEVYSEAIEAALRKNKQVLVMLPEIAMTAALMDRLTARFGARPTEWHSELTEKQRRLSWHAIQRGTARFVLGARSALFLPYKDLGLIIVDEEHEAAFKQEEGVIYHGRDMAVVRANLEKIPIILASATPSLETLRNAEQKKYHHVVLRERFGKARMPDIKCVDLRQEKLPPQEFISAPLFEALQKNVAAQKQAMLFLNRRGYAPLTLCRACGHRLNCPHCTSWLIEHKKAQKLRCHHCDYSARLPPACPSCRAEGKFAACGPGIERIAEEVARRLPNVRFAIMASDTLDGPKGAQDLVDRMNGDELDLLIGTQIMAKGYHFPRLTLVGVIDADLGLSGGDPRAAERTFQLLQQVAGRSGRSADAGQVWLQTTAPDHPVMQALMKGDRDKFMAAELKERAAYNLPPFSRLASITVSAVNGADALAAANQIAAAAPRFEKLRILGPAPAPFAVLRGRTRHRLMVQADRALDLSTILRDWLAVLKFSYAIRIQVDVDPYSFF